MRIEIIKTLRGANIYSDRPVTLMEMDLGEIAGKKSAEVGDFNFRLVEYFPGLNKHHCRLAQPGGFIEELNNGTYFNHVVEHLAIELLTLSGFDHRDKKACFNDQRDQSRAVIETTMVETTRYLMPVAAELVEDIVKERTFSYEKKIAEAKKIAADTELGQSGKAIVDAAERRGIPWMRENEHSLVQLGYGKNLHLVQAALTDHTSLIGADMAGNKDETKKRLSKFSMPVPFGKIVRSEEEILEAFESIGPPVVVKPLDGRQGKGVSLNLKTTAEVAEAFRTARQFSSRVLIEELFEGNNYRVLVIGGKMIAASERLPCFVTGDGEHSIAELIEIENQNPLRGDGHEKPLTKIKITPVLLAAMRKENLDLEDIPPAGDQILLCNGMNLSTGGTARDVTDLVHPTIKNLCERAARIINLDICGVDLVLPDIARPVPPEKAGIIELNAAPGLRMHILPTEGESRDVGGAIIEMLYPKGQNGRIPIIAVTGTNGKTTVTRMIAHILSDIQTNVGMATTDGIYLFGEKIIAGDTTGPVSAKMILSDRAVEIAVLETARGGIVRRGLGFDWSDVSVVTNISEDHIGQDGIETIQDLINIKALIAERVRPNGTLVINADCENSLSILEREKVKATPKRIVLFSLDENNPHLQDHLRNGGIVYFRKGNWIIEAMNKGRNMLLKINSIPATMNGAADFQIANALAAIAACRACGLWLQNISRLYSFQNDVNTNPGRNNLYRVQDGYVLIDYGHNAEAFAAIGRMAASWKDKIVTGIIGVPGDRDDRIIKDAARIAARGFHRIIIKEDKDLRGRKSGDVARLLCETVNGERPELRCDVVLDEVRAFSNALQDLKENEVVVIFYDKLEPILKILAEHQATPVSGFETNGARTQELAVV